jgi:hypothetical protein
MSPTGTPQAVWIARDDGWRVATIQGHELKLRQTGPQQFQVSIDDQARTRRGPDASLLDLQISLTRTALMLPPR